MTKRFKFFAALSATALLLSACAQEPDEDTDDVAVDTIEEVLTAIVTLGHIEATGDDEYGPVDGNGPNPREDVEGQDERDRIWDEALRTGSNYTQENDGFTARDLRRNLQGEDAPTKNIKETVESMVAMGRLDKVGGDSWRTDARYRQPL